MKKINKKGFTLVELLAVVVILGVLLLIAVPAMSNVINNSKKNSFLSSVKMVAENVENLSSMSSYMGTGEDCALAITEEDIPLDRGSYGDIKGYVLYKSGKVEVYAYDNKLEASAKGVLKSLAIDTETVEYSTPTKKNVCSNSSYTDQTTCETNRGTWRKDVYEIDGTVYPKCKFD